MKRDTTPLRLAALGCLGLTLAGCALPLQSRGPQPSEEAIAACNSRGDEVFLRQNRDALYKADTYQSSVRDSPYGGGTLTGTNAGLSDQYARNQDVRSCLNGTAAPIRSEPAATAAP